MPPEMIKKSRVNVQEIIIEQEFLENQSANYRAYTQDLADFILPRKAWITSIRTKGERVKFNFLYDSTGIRALRIMSAGFHSNLTNPSSRWFALETRNKELMKDGEVRAWFRKVEDTMLAALNASNFYNIIQEFYTDFGGFGTGTFLMLSDVKDGVRFTSIPVQQANRVLDGNDRMTAFYRKFRMTARQANGMWGAKAGESVIKSLEKKQFEEFEFIHYVGPRSERQAGKEDALNMPFKSVWIAKKDKHLIYEGGFMEMPYMSEVFYKDESDPNGFSPAMDVFADIKLVNAMKRTIIRAAMKQADPPLVMPSRGFILPLNFNPVGINYRDSKTANDAIQALPVGQGKLGITVDLLELQQKNIEEGMFVPLFRALNEITKQMTIPEVQRRVAENMVLLGPVVGRATHGILDPVITRLFNMMYRAGQLPEPPEILQDQDFTPVYLSPLAKAQRGSEIGDIEAFLGDVQAIASVLPQALDKIDEDKTIDVLARIRGISPEIIREDEVIARMRQHRAEQDQMIAQLQMAQGAAGIAKDGAAAEKASAEAKA